MAGLTGSLLKLIAGIEQEDLPHHGLGEFLKLRRVAGLADLTSHIGGLFRRRCPLGEEDPPKSKESYKQSHTNPMFHLSLLC
jgi:hypothetical protein